MCPIILDIQLLQSFHVLIRVVGIVVFYSVFDVMFCSGAHVDDDERGLVLNVLVMQQQRLQLSALVLAVDKGV